MPYHPRHRAWLGLNLTLTPRQVGLLLSAFPSPQQAWGATPAQLARVPGFSRWVEGFLQRRAQADLEAECRAVDRLGLNVHTLEDADYPDGLRSLAHPPPVLYSRGTWPLSGGLALAVVGTRRASAYGRRVCAQLVGDLSHAGAVIVSGLALGVDAVAHAAALDAGAPTVAVLGSGLGQVYPPENRALAERIAGAGTLLSEFPVFTAPARWTFPQRNRVISGLCRGVIVVEGGLKSGALITAKAALDQGREVFAVPGPVTHPNARGCHHLLRHGATLVECAQDVLASFSLSTPPRAAVPPRDLAPHQAAVLEALSHEPRHVNGVVEGLDRPAAEVLAALVELSLLGLAAEAEPQHFVRL